MEEQDLLINLPDEIAQALSNGASAVSQFFEENVADLPESLEELDLPIELPENATQAITAGAAGVEQFVEYGQDQVFANLNDEELDLPTDLSENIADAINTYAIGLQEFLEEGNSFFDSLLNGGAGNDNSQDTLELSDFIALGQSTLPQNSGTSEGSFSSGSLFPESGQISPMTGPMEGIGRSFSGF